MESEASYNFTICLKLYERKQPLLTFSVAWTVEKVSTKLESARKVNHAGILVKLGQKGFPNRDFQSETYIPSHIPLMLRGNL